MPNNAVIIVWRVLLNSGKRYSTYTAQHSHTVHTQHTQYTHTQYTHSTHTVHTQYTHSTHTTHTHTVHTHSTHTVHTQYTHSTHTVHTQHTHSIHTQQTFPELTPTSDSQKHIYYLSAPSRETALSSPYYETLAQNDLEVLLSYNKEDDVVLFR